MKIKLKKKQNWDRVNSKEFRIHFQLDSFILLNITRSSNGQKWIVNQPNILDVLASRFMFRLFDVKGQLSFSFFSAQPHEAFSIAYEKLRAVGIQRSVVSWMLNELHVLEHNFNIMRKWEVHTHAAKKAPLPPLHSIYTRLRSKLLLFVSFFFRNEIGRPNRKWCFGQCLTWMKNRSCKTILDFIAARGISSVNFEFDSRIENAPSQ